MKPSTITIVARYPLSGRPTEIIKLEYDNKTTLYDLLSNLTSDLNSFTFSKYYPSDYYYWIMLDKKCPYIRVDGELYWNVPYSEIHVSDFLSTHFLLLQNEIEVDVDNEGGFEDFDIDLLIQSWTHVWTIISNGMPLLSFLRYVISKFGRKEKTPLTYELQSFVNSRDCWNPEELAEELCVTEDFAENILDYVGYEKHEGKYWKNTWKGELLERKIGEIEYSKYIKDYTESALAISKEWGSDMKQNIDSLVFCLYELCVDIDEIEKYDNVMEKISVISSENGIDDFEKYEVMKALIVESIWEIIKEEDIQ